jgi:uncharacterized protein
MDFEKHLTDMLKDAMKAGDKTRLMAIRSIKSILMNERTRSAGPIEEDRAIELLSGHRKKMTGALVQYNESKRDDLIESSEAEIAICDQLLPARISDDEVVRIVKEKIAQTGASSMKDLGKIIGPIMKELSGQVDGNYVRELISKQLGG